MKKSRREPPPPPRPRPLSTEDLSKVSGGFGTGNSGTGHPNPPIGPGG
jgi:hypothetical protein